MASVLVNKLNSFLTSAATLSPDGFSDRKTLIAIPSIYNSEEKKNLR
jgi:hypothetical protein